MTNSSNKNSSSKNCKSNNSLNANSNQNGLGLASISYADFVILSSTLSYAIAEELNDSDLNMLIVFLGMIESDLALLSTKRNITNAQNETLAESEDVESEAIVEEDISESNDELTSLVASRSNNKRRKRIKRIRKKKKYIKK